jgi:hypothetical protein
VLLEQRDVLYLNLGRSVHRLSSGATVRSGLACRGQRNYEPRHTLLAEQFTMRSFSLLVVAFAVFTAACGVPSIPGVGSMTMKIDGKSWSAMPGTAVTTATASLSSIIISGSNNGTTETINTVTINLKGTAAGTYSLDDSNNTVVMGNASMNYKNKQPTGGGSVVITKFDATGVEGTFTVTEVATDNSKTLAITEGTFSTAKN